MQTIDVLGYRPDRYNAFTQQMLAESEDETLQSIVQNAAQELNTPIALVNLVLSQVQFFKAHYGLPAPLEAARGTSRDASFCQYVVRDGKPFQVVDAKTDSRIPQQLVDQYGIRAYLGVPVFANDQVVGSLCVIDMEPRTFSAEEEAMLVQLAQLVNARLALMSARQAQQQTQLRLDTTLPALATIRNASAPINTLSTEGLIAVKTLEQFLRVAHFAIEANDKNGLELLRQELKLAEEALDICQNNLFEINASYLDFQDTLAATEHLIVDGKQTTLSDVIFSGRDLVSDNLHEIGSVFIADLDGDPELATSGSLAVALLAVTLTNIATKMREDKLAGGIRLRTVQDGDFVNLLLRGNHLSAARYDEVLALLQSYVNGDPTIRLLRQNDRLVIRFLTLT